MIIFEAQTTQQMESVMGMINEFDTIAAIATAVSNAGIGIIRISGSEAMTILSNIFEPYNKKVDVHQLENHRIYYGNIKDGQEVIDECIVLIMKGPHSYTKEDVVEIDCHGGVTVVYKVLNLVLKNGARAAEPGEFTKRAFLNGRIAAVKESLKTFARNVAYRTIRITGVIIDVNNIPLSLKNSFLFLFINANTVLISVHLQSFPCDCKKYIIHTAFYYFIICE